MSETPSTVRDVAKELNSVIEEERRALLSSGRAPTVSNPSALSTTKPPNSSVRTVIGSAKSAPTSKTAASAPLQAPTTPPQKTPSSAKTDEPWLQIKFHLDGTPAEVTGGNMRSLSMGALQRVTERLPRFVMEAARRENQRNG